MVTVHFRVSSQLCVNQKIGVWCTSQGGMVALPIKEVPTLSASGGGLFHINGVMGTQAYHLFTEANAAALIAGAFLKPGHGSVPFARPKTKVQAFFPSDHGQLCRDGQGSVSPLPRVSFVLLPFFWNCRRRLTYKLNVFRLRRRWASEVLYLNRHKQSIQRAVIPFHHKRAV